MTGLLNDLATLTAIRLSSLSAGPDAMRVGVVFTGTGTVRILSKDIGRDNNPALGRYGAMQQVMRGMMPILSVMKVGRDKPQHCARESTKKLTTAPLAVGAVTAF